MAAVFHYYVQWSVSSIHVLIDMVIFNIEYGVWRHTFIS